MTPSRPTAAGASPRYPVGTVRTLLDSDAVTAATRRAVESRLADDGGLASPRFFDAPAFATLRAVCARLVPQPERARPVDLAAEIDDRLARALGDGWRYASLPPDGESHRRGLEGLDDVATTRFGTPFVALDAGRQDAVLRAVQRGEVQGVVWAAMPAGRFFEELLAEAAEAYYSHPLAQDEIGYAGMADAPGWHAIGLNELEPREPRPLTSGGDA